MADDSTDRLLMDKLLKMFNSLKTKEKEEFFFQLLTKDATKLELMGIIRKHKSLLEKFMCNEDVFICYGCIKSTYIDHKCLCAGCCLDYCFNCMSMSYDNVKSKGWYCCRNQNCQKIYDDDK